MAIEAEMAKWMHGIDEEYRKKYGREPEHCAGAELSCSEWLDELEAARDSIWSVRQRAAKMLTSEEWYALYRTLEVIQKLIAAQPSRSSSGAGKVRRE